MACWNPYTQEEASLIQVKELIGSPTIDLGPKGSCDSPKTDSGPPLAKLPRSPVNQYLVEHTKRVEYRPVFILLMAELGCLSQPARQLYSYLLFRCSLVPILVLSQSDSMVRHSITLNARLVSSSLVSLVRRIRHSALTLFLPGSLYCTMVFGSSVSSKQRARIGFILVSNLLERSMPVQI